MMFMISGRAVNANGSPIVRDGLVAAVHEAGHEVVTSQPRRGSYAYVDYLVATDDSIRRRVAKVRWAAERGIRVINYYQMWRLINDSIVPDPVALPGDMEVADQHGETVTRPSPEQRPSMADIADQAIADRREMLMQRLREQEHVRVTEAEASAAEHEAVASAPPIRTVGTYDENGVARTHTTTAPKNPEPVPSSTRPPRRRIVTGR